MSGISRMVEKCRGGRKSVWVCLNNRTTTLDEIDIVPGLLAKVFIKGHPANQGRKYVPTVVELSCKDLQRYLSKRRLNDEVSYSRKDRGTNG
jgi:hypothetical protein